MSRHFTIDDLPRDVYLEAVRLAGERSTTGDTLWRWLYRSGHNISHSSVGRWLQRQHKLYADPSINLRQQLASISQTLTADQLQHLIQIATAPTMRHAVLAPQRPDPDATEGSST